MDSWARGGGGGVWPGRARVRVVAAERAQTSHEEGDDAADAVGAGPRARDRGGG
jgi:hypothetical protein